MSQTDPTEVLPLAQRLAQGVEALRQGAFARAAELLCEVCDDPSFIAAGDLMDIRSRASSLCAEALLLAGRPSQASPRADAALALARSLGDIEGINEIENLQNRIRTANITQQTKTSAGSSQTRTISPPSPKVAPQPHDLAQAEHLLEQSSAQIESGQIDGARQAAERALVLADGHPRVAVLGRLLVARAAPAHATVLLSEAAEIAREASEPTLLGLVIRTAQLLGVDVDAARPHADRSLLR